MTLDCERLSSLLGLLYEGLACPERWTDFLSAVSRYLDCDKAAIVFHDRTNRNPAMGFYVGLPEDAMRDYNAHFGARNPAAHRILTAALTNGSWHGLVRSVVDERAYRKSEYYDGWGRKNGVYHAVVGVASNDAASATSLSIMRAESAGPLDRDAEDLLRILTPHLRRAFQLQTQLEQLRIAKDGAYAALETMETGVIAVDGAGRVVLMNSAAEALLKGKAGLTLRDGFLTATNPSQSCGLARLIRSAALTGAGRGRSSGGRIAIQRGDGTRPLVVSAAPFHSSHLFADQQPCALIFISDPESRPRSRSALMSSIFGLTPAECRLTDMLLEDLELRSAAAKMSITTESARFMLKRIFQKTATHRQSQLIRLLMMIPGSGEAAAKVR